MESICNLGQNGIWLYLLITLISTIIGAFGAIMVDSKTSAEIKSSNLQVSKAWKEKFILAFIASACTPLVLYLTNKCEILCGTSDSRCNLLIYVGYSLILATFGEIVVKKLGEFLWQIGDSLKSFFGSQAK